jgi:uncharacterized protein (DUF427 family)
MRPNYDVVVNERFCRNAAWYYPKPKEGSKRIQNHIAFRHGMRIER